MIAVADSTLLGVAAIIAAVFSGIATVLGALNRKSLQVPRRNADGGGQEKRQGIGEMLSEMQSEQRRDMVKVNNRIDVHEARAANVAHGK